MAAEAKKAWNPHWGAWVWIKWKQGAPEDALESWKNIKQIKQAWSTTGEWDCALWLDIDDPNEIERVVWREIGSNKWADTTENPWANTFG